MARGRSGSEAASQDERPSQGVDPQEGIDLIRGNPAFGSGKHFLERWTGPGTLVPVAGWRDAGGGPVDPDLDARAGSPWAEFASQAWDHAAGPDGQRLLMCGRGVVRLTPVTAQGAGVPGHRLEGVGQFAPGGDGSNRESGLCEAVAGNGKGEVFLAHGSPLGEAGGTIVSRLAFHPDGKETDVVAIAGDAAPTHAPLFQNQEDAQKIRIPSSTHQVKLACTDQARVVLALDNQLLDLVPREVDGARTWSGQWTMVAVPHGTGRPWSRAILDLDVLPCGGLLVTFLDGIFYLPPAGGALAQRVPLYRQLKTTGDQVAADHWFALTQAWIRPVGQPSGTPPTVRRGPLALVSDGGLAGMGTSVGGRVSLPDLVQARIAALATPSAFQACVALFAMDPERAGRVVWSVPTPAPPTPDGDSLPVTATTAAPGLGLDMDPSKDEEKGTGASGSKRLRVPKPPAPESEAR